MTGDNWIVECNTKYWIRDQPIRLRHADTKKHLYTRKADKFTNQNCRGCPIIGQLEISSKSAASESNSLWKSNEGLYFPHDSTEL
jgi:hypothetical protein